MEGNKLLPLISRFYWNWRFDMTHACETGVSIGLSWLLGIAGFYISTESALWLLAWYDVRILQHYRLNNGVTFADRLRHVRVGPLLNPYSYAGSLKVVWPVFWRFSFSYEQFKKQPTWIFDWSTLFLRYSLECVIQQNEKYFFDGDEQY